MTQNKRAGVVVLLGLLTAASACGGSSASPSSPSTSLANRAPVIGALTVSPQGVGLQSATVFTFTGQNVSDPDGDPLTYSWVSDDGASISSSTPTASHVYSSANTFVMRLTVTDSKGLSASASATVTVGTVAGVWDVTCNRSAQVLQSWPTFPTSFVATLIQSGGTVSGSMAGGGQSHSFTLPGTTADPRGVTFGVETMDNAWANQDGDFYFHLVLDETLNSATSSSAGFYCGAATARKR